MAVSRFIALLDHNQDSGAAERREATLAGIAIAQSSFGLAVNKMYGTSLHALRSNKDAGGLGMAILEQHQAYSDHNYCDIFLMLRDNDTVYRRMAASTVGAICLGKDDFHQMEVEYFHAEMKPVIVVDKAAGGVGQNVPGRIHHEPDVDKAILRIREMALNN